MRTVKDHQGVTWSVDVLAGSYGAVYLIFSAEGAGAVRKAPLWADSELEAHADLASMGEDTLRDRLDDSTAFEEMSELGF